MRLSDLKAEDIIITDSGFTCVPEGNHVVEADDLGLFIRCSDGKHYLDGQEDDFGDLVGITLTQS